MATNLSAIKSATRSIAYKLTVFVLVIFFTVLFVVILGGYYHNNPDKRELSQSEYEKLNVALDEVCVIDTKYCNPAENKDVQFFTYSVPYLYREIDKLFGNFPAVTHKVEDGYTVTLYNELLDMPSALVVVVYHELTHVLQSDHRLYETGSLKQFEQCLDHNSVKDTTRNAFLKMASISDKYTPHLEYAKHSHGNKIKDCS